MRRVFTSSSDVIHLFAEQSQSDARCTNVFFNGNKIYSYGYHYLLGEFIDKDTIMINDNSPTVTTSKHVRELSYGTRKYRQFFTTQTDLKLIMYQVDDNVKKLASARKPHLYMKPIIDLWNSLHEYLKYTRTKTKVSKTKEYKRFAKIVDTVNNDYTNYLDELVKEEVAKFYNYDIDSFILGDEDYLRLSIDLDMVETSQGIKIDKLDAIKLYRLIQLGRDIKGYRISYYTVTSINGTLKIGCHNINMESVHRVGKQLLS